MTNNTAFAEAYRKASEALMDAIANPSRDTFNTAQQWAVRARREAVDIDGEGSERDLAGRLFESIVAASRHHYCSLIY